MPLSVKAWCSRKSSSNGCELRRGFMEPQAWFLGIAYLLLCTLSTRSASSCPPSCEASTPTSLSLVFNFLTVPPYIPATVLVIIIAYFADKTRVRGPFMLALLPISMIGYIMLLATNDPKVKYGATFLIALGVYPTAPCILSLPINNNSGLYKRATVIALQLMWPTWPASSRRSFTRLTGHRSMYRATRWRWVF